MKEYLGPKPDPEVVSIHEVFLAVFFHILCLAVPAVKSPFKLQVSGFRFQIILVSLVSGHHC